MDVNNQAFPVIGVDRLNYIADFALGNTRIVEGRDFTTEELNKGSKVCVLSQSLAIANGVKVGDTINVRYYNADVNSPYTYSLSSGHGIVNPSAGFYMETTPFIDDGQSYTVVGLYRSRNEWGDPAENLYSFTPNTIFVPKTSVNASLDYCNQGLFRSYVLYNEKLNDFQQLAATAGYPDLFKCDDHGYSAISSGLHDYNETAQRTLVVGLCLSGLIAVLFLLLSQCSNRKRLI